MVAPLVSEALLVSAALLTLLLLGLRTPRDLVMRRAQLAWADRPVSGATLA